MSRDDAGNCLCGIAVSLHFDDKNRMKGCDYAATRLKPVDRGRLFGLKLKKNHESRQAALQSIAPSTGTRGLRGWRARIGGAVRGRTVFSPNREVVERMIHEHYNELMLAFVEQRPAAKP